MRLFRNMGLSLSPAILIAGVDSLAKRGLRLKGAVSLVARPVGSTSPSTSSVQRLDPR